MKLRHAAALMVIAILIVGCGSQSSPDKTTSQNSPETASDFGCKLSNQDVQRLCAYIANQPKLNKSGSGAYQEIIAKPPPYTPAGFNVVMSVEC